MVWVQHPSRVNCLIAGPHAIVEPNQADMGVPHLRVELGCWFLNYDFSYLPEYIKDQQHKHQLERDCEICDSLIRIITRLLVGVKGLVDEVSY